LEDSRFSVADKVIVITGSTGILGRAYSEAFACGNSQLIIADLATSSLHKQAAELTNKYGEHIQAIECDVSQEQQVVALFNQIYQKHKRIDAVVNNAAATGEHLMRAGNVEKNLKTIALQCGKKSWLSI